MEFVGVSDLLRVNAFAERKIVGLIQIGQRLLLH